MILLWELLVEFLYVGLFSLGGGYATIPLIQNRIIDVHGWINTKQFIDMITISQMTPGPLTVNIATFVGLNIAGLPGAILATIGSVFTGVALTLFIYASYTKATNKKNWDLFLKSLRISSTALIIIATILIFNLLLLPNNTFELKSFIVFGVILLMSVYKKLDTMKILGLSAIFGLLWLL